jgi:hypothetical protein
MTKDIALVLLRRPIAELPAEIWKAFPKRWRVSLFPDTFGFDGLDWNPPLRNQLNLSDKC